MAIHANSTPVPARPLLGPAATLGRLLCGYDLEPESAPQSGLAPRGAAPRQSELLAILNAGPIASVDLAHLSRQRQKRAEAGIAALIDLLDALDGDPDLEDGGDTEPNCGDVGTYGANDECEGDDADSEPSLGATCFGSLWQDLWSSGDRRDLEEQCEDEGACIQSQPHDGETDQEPALGAPDGQIDQIHWHGGPTMYSDESEASLGAPENPDDQRLWSQGSGSVELDHDEQSGLRSWGTYNETRLRTEQLRRETEAMLRRKGLVKDRSSNLILLHNGQPFVSGAVW